MTTHIVGRDSRILDEIKSGRKTVEIRLAKPRFRAFKPGDLAWIREDNWENGVIVESKMSDVYTKVTKTEIFDSFEECLRKVGFKNAVPYAENLDEAISECYKFYTKEEETTLGVIAIHFQLCEQHYTPGV